MNYRVRASDFTELQQKVISIATEKLSKYPWFKNVCTDRLPSDEKLQSKSGIQDAVDVVIYDTTYFDAPITHYQ